LPCLRLNTFKGSGEISGKHLAEHLGTFPSMDLIPLLDYNMKCDKFLQAVKGNHHDLKCSLADLQCLARCDGCFFSTGGGGRCIGQTIASPAIAKILLTSKLQIFKQSSGSFSAVWLLRLIGSVEDLHELFFSAFRPDGHGSDGAIYWVLVGLRRQWQVASVSWVGMICLYAH
jgi:hypothetical protein